MTTVSRRVALAAGLAAAAGCGRRPTAGPAPAAPAALAGPPPILTALPKDHEGQSPLPLLVTMHGMGGRPRDFLGDQFQDLADRFRTAVLGVTAPLADRAETFAWSDDPAVNASRVEQSVVAFRRQVSFAFSRTVILAYSQGAFAALNLGLEHAHLARGILAVSPGSLTNPKLPEGRSSLKGKVFVLCYGERDEANWVRQAKERMATAKARGATVDIYSYPNEGHLIPDDLYERLGAVFRAVESLGPTPAP